MSSAALHISNKHSFKFQGNEQRKHPPLSRRHSSNLTVDSFLDNIPKDPSYIRYLNQSGETRSSVKDSSISKSGSVSSLLNTSSNSEDVFLFPKTHSRESSLAFKTDSAKDTPSSSVFRTRLVYYIINICLSVVSFFILYRIIRSIYVSFARR